MRMHFPNELRPRRPNKAFALLHPEENGGVRLTTGFLLEPEQSTSAIVAHHSGAQYFVAWEDCIFWLILESPRIEKIRAGTLYIADISRYQG